MTENPVVEGNGKIPYSGSKASFEAAGKQTDLEIEEKGSKLCPHEEQPGERCVDRSKAQTSPEQIHLCGANRPKQRTNLRERNNNYPDYYGNG